MAQKITSRQFRTIRQSLYYMRDPYGSLGHNQLELIALFATHVGFRLSDNNWTLEVPREFEITDDINP